MLLKSYAPEIFVRSGLGGQKILGTFNFLIKWKALLSLLINSDLKNFSVPDMAAINQHTERSGS